MGAIQGFYRCLSRFPLRYVRYAFVDTAEYLADGLFIRHQVRVDFGDEWEKPDSVYKVIFCKVRKRDVSRFAAAMEELPNKMLLCGHSDYLEFCNELWGGIHSGLGESATIVETT